jgi:hypothetical protein
MEYGGTSVAGAYSAVQTHNGGYAIAGQIRSFGSARSFSFSEQHCFIIVADELKPSFIKVFLALSVDQADAE